MTIHFGDNSTIATFSSLPAIDGSALTNMNNNSSITNIVAVRQAAENSSAEETNFTTNTSAYQLKVEKSITTVSNSRVLCIFGFAIRNSDGSDNQRTNARVTVSNGSFVGGNFEASTKAGYSNFEGSKLDIGGNTGTRTYKIEYNRTGNNALIKDAYLFLLEIRI